MFYGVVGWESYMDLEYLVALQSLRESLGAFPETVMLAFSFIGEGPILVVVALLVYWCVDKRAGQLTIASLGVSVFATQLAKNIACVYRPWIRDARIVPSVGALNGATGYSFPSGHTSGSTALFGSIAFSFRHKHKVTVAMCVACIVIIAFSRNYLGVHTPQDVLVGFLVAAVSIAGANAFLNWIAACDVKRPNHNLDIIACGVVIAICVASIVVVELKTYPMHYVDGVLLVDSEAMKKGSFEAAGLLGGLALGWLLERRFVSFSTDGVVGLKERMMRGVIGAVVVGAVYVAGDFAFKALLPYNWAKLFAYFLLSFVALFVVPALFDRLPFRQR